MRYRYIACCIVDRNECSAAILADLGRAGFTAAEVGICATSPPSGSFSASARLARDEEVDLHFGGASVVGVGHARITGPDGVEDLNLAPDEVWPASAMPRSRSGIGGAVSPTPMRRAVAIAQDQDGANVRRFLHLPARLRISVRTQNGYEVETILEIFRAHGGSHCVHEVDPLARAGVLPQSGAGPVHDHTTVLSERIRESA